MNTELHPRNLTILPPDMQKILDEFDVEAKNIRDSELQCLSSEPPSNIYHYTDDAGLRGILESGSFRLTDIFALNDPSELNYAVLQAVTILNRKTANGPPEAQRIAKLFESFVTKDGVRYGQFFVCCFSTCGNDLGQWRAYADNGRGYAMEFDGKLLVDTFRDEHSPGAENVGFEVQYSDQLLQGIYTKLADELLSSVSRYSEKSLPNGVIKSCGDELYVKLALQVIYAMPYFKHKAYNNEAEYRFLQHAHAIDQTSLKTRPRRYSLVKYREFDWKSKVRLALKRIVIGPAADREIAQRFAELCVREFHGGDVEIIRSQIPYRAV